MKTNEKLPVEIARKLDASLRRVRIILFLRGVLATLATFVVAILGIMAIDAMVLIFSPVVRWLLWGAGMGATAAVGYLALVRPFRLRLSAAEIAALIERNHPELEERLSTVVELAEAGELEDGSRMLEQLKLDAVRDAVAVTPQKEFTSRTVKPRLVAAALALAILALLFALFPKATLRLVTRAVVPSAEVDNVYASALRVSPGDQVLLEGSSLTVNLAVDSGFPSKAYVRTKVDGRSETSERMTGEGTGPDGEGRTFYSFSYPKLTKSFTYRMHCGSALTRGYRVEVVPEPSFSDRWITVEHPAYTGRVRDVNTNSAEVVALVGSTVRVSVKPSADGLAGAALVLPNGQSVPGESAPGGRQEFAFRVDETCRGAWHVALWDRHGFSNRVERATMSVVRDTPPKVELAYPEEYDLTLPPKGRLPISFAVSDDFGPQQTEIEVSVAGGPWQRVCEVALAEAGAFRWSGDETVRLEAIERGEATELKLRVRSQDGCPAESGGPGVGLSREIVVHLLENAKSLEEQGLRQELAESRDALDAILKELGTAVWRSKDAASSFREFNAAHNEWHRNAANRSLAYARASISNGEIMLSDFIASLEGTRLESGAALFEPVLEGYVSPVRQEAEDVALMEKDEDKAAPAALIQPHVQRAIDELLAARVRFEALEKAAEALLKLEEFAQREQELADEARDGELDPREFADLEQALEREFEEAFREELKEEDNPLQSMEEQAAELARRLAELKQRQDALRDQAAASASEAERNALADAEQQLARDVDKVTWDTRMLADAIDRRMGGVDSTDEAATSANVREAVNAETEALSEARQSAEAIRQGQAESARETMQQTSAALEAAKKALETAQQDMAAREAAASEASQGMRDLAQELKDAVASAEAAAQAWEAQGGGEGGEQEPPEGEGEGGEQEPPEGEGEGGAEEPPSGEGEGNAEAQQQGAGKGDAEKNAAAQAAAAQAAQSMGAQAGAKSQRSGLKSGRSPGKGPSRSSGGRSRETRQHQISNGRATGPRGVQGTVKRAEGETDWFKLKSESKSEAESDGLDDVPEEYRTLVRDYFRALQEGGQTK